MRVSDNQFFNTMMYTVRNSNIELNKLYQQITTNEKIHAISDDPIGAMQLQTIEENKVEFAQYDKNIDLLLTKYNRYETHLNSIETATQRLNELFIYSRNGALTKDDRDAIAIEVNGLREEMLHAFNTTEEGYYIFSGTDIDQPAITYDSATKTYTLTGNNDYRFTEVGDNRNYKSNVTVDDVIVNLDLFNSIEALLVELQTPTVNYDANIETAQVLFKEGQEQVINSLGKLGADYAELERFNRTNDDLVFYNDLLYNEINSVDFAQTSAKLEQEKAGLQISYTVFANIIQKLSLFNEI